MTDLRMAVRRRDFTALDNGSAPKVAIVNQAFVRQYFDGQNPIGEHVVIPSTGERIEVIGVSADAKYTELRGAMPPTVYFPALQQVDGNASFAVRIARPNPNAGATFAAIRSAVRQIDPALPVLDLRTQDEQIDRLHGQELVFAKLSGLFGGVALLPACVGLYGLMSHAVSQRTGEIGLRMALGALRPEAADGPRSSGYSTRSPADPQSPLQPAGPDRRRTGTRGVASRHFARFPGHRLRFPPSGVKADRDWRS